MFGRERQNLLTNLHHTNTLLRRAFFFLAILLVQIKGQDFSYSAGLTSLYGDGRQRSLEIGRGELLPYIYREHFLDLTAGYGSFFLWSNLEFSSPPQIGPMHSGLRKIRLLWEGQTLSVSVGDLYGQFGRGLALNLWENQGIDWDTSLRGIWLKSRLRDVWSIDVLTGRIAGGRHLPVGPGVDPRIRDFSDNSEVSALSVFRSNIVPGASLGGYVVRVNSSNPWFSKMRNLFEGGYVTVDSANVQTQSVTPGLMGEYLGPDFDLYVEVTRREHRIIDGDSLFSSAQSKWFTYEDSQRGWGGYGSISYYPGRLGMTVEYKNYMYDSSDLDKRRHLPFRLGRSSSIQRPPSAFREHSSTLLSRTPHVMDFEDEVGMQVEANFEANEDIFLLFNYAASSRHVSFQKVFRPDFSTEWMTEETEMPLWMDAREQYYPFREIYGEINAHFDQLGLDFKGMISQSSEIIVYDAFFIERAGASEWLSSQSKRIVTWEKRNLLTLPTELTVNLPLGLGLTLYWEHQWEDLQLKTYIGFEDQQTGAVDSVTTDEVNSVPYYYRYVAVNIGKPSRFTVGLVYDYASKLKTGQSANADPGEDSWLEAVIRRNGVDLRNKWFGVQSSVYVTPSTILSLFYGSLQGGLKCDSGVCVYVPGIEDALTISLTSNF